MIKFNSIPEITWVIYFTMNNFLFSVIWLMVCRITFKGLCNFLESGLCTDSFEIWDLSLSFHYLNTDVINAFITIQVEHETHCAY